MSTADKNKYLSDKVKPFLEPMLVELLKERPKDSLKWMQRWLSRNGNDVQVKMMNLDDSTEEPAFDILVNKPKDSY